MELLIPSSLKRGLEILLFLKDMKAIGKVKMNRYESIALARKNPTPRYLSLHVVKLTSVKAFI